MSTFPTARVFAFGLLIARISAAQAVDRGAFVMIQRGDTVAIERFTRARDSIAVDLTIKTQGRFVYVARTANDFTISQMNLQFYRPNAAPDAPPIQTAGLTLKGDSVIAEISGGGQKQTQRLKTVAGAVMLPPSSFTAFEQLTMRERAARQPVSVPVFATSGGRTATASLTPLGNDSVVATIATQEYRLKVDDVGRILGGASPAIGLTISRIDAATAAKLALGKPDYSAPADAPYTNEEISIAAATGMVLGGTLTLPKNPNSALPAVVTITGSGQQDRDEYIPVAGGYRPFRQIADTLARRGIAVLRLDDRGVGSSTGNPATSSTVDFANDIRAAVAYLRTRREIDPARIALLGHSEGGIIAPMVAATDPRIKAIVLMAGPVDNGMKIIRYQQQYALEHDTSLTATKRDSLFRYAQVQLDSLARHNQWIRFFLSYDPDSTAKKVKVPTLILQGATDRQVPAEQAERLAAAFRSGGNHDVTVRVFPDRNHLFLADPNGNPQGYTRLTSSRIDADVLGTIADWLAGKLK
ncbi:MAG: alpha/beta hydrolase family protein [Gemmatimonadaceae bacterium]